MAEPAIVYRFFDEAGVLLYVGLTVVGPTRWGQHSVEQPWWRRVSTVKVTHFDTLEEAAVAERRAIESEEPLYNVTFRFRRPKRVPGRTRRPSGMGSVFQNTDGRWVAQMGVGPRGARKFYRKNVATKELAEAALQEMLARVAAGMTPRDPQRAPKVAA